MAHILTAKLFKYGSSQAARRPTEFHIKGEEVLIYREGGRIILQPKESNWDDFFLSEQRVSDDFICDRNDLPPQNRKLF